MSLIKYLKARILSFKWAFHGLNTLLINEPNARIHLVAAMAVVLTGFYYHISIYEWVAICFSIGFVFSMELVNSSIEEISDFVSPEKHRSIKKVKDLAAAAVLISAITAFIVGLIIFIPKVLETFQP